MITDQDVRKLVGALENKLATKTDLGKMERRMESKFALKDDLLKLEKRFNNKYDKLFILVDGIAKRVRDIWEELSLTEHRVEKMEKSRQRIGV